MTQLLMKDLGADGHKWFVGTTALLKETCQPRKGHRGKNKGFQSEGVLMLTRAVTVLDFSLPRWCSNKYRGLAVNRTTPPPPPPSVKKIWRGRTCASAWSAAPKRLRAAEPRHIVAGLRFHWSREEMHIQRQA